MSSTRFELLRSAFETIEIVEKALTQAYSYKDRYPKEYVVCDILISKFVAIIQRKSQEILMIYNDQDAMFREESEIISGQRFSSDSQQSRMQGEWNQMLAQNPVMYQQQPPAQARPDVWSNFYDKLNDTYVFHERYQTGAMADELESTLDSDALFGKVMDDVIDYCDKKFTAEEGNGRYLDLHEHYLAFGNIKKLRQMSTSGQLKADDYLTWIQNFDKHQRVPAYVKTSSKYEAYLENIKNYLVHFFKKTQPLVSWDKIQEQTDEMFESEWEQGSLFGWEETILKIRGAPHQDNDTNSLHCIACNKTYSNENVFQHHKKGRPHIKAVNELSKKGGVEEIEEQKVPQRSEFTETEMARLKNVACLETWILKLKNDLLQDVFLNTENLVRKKQSKHYNELEADYEMNDLEAKKAAAIHGGKGGADGAGSDDEDERPKYNPKNLPMGWDGKPIPYWLYKLHGLGVEFKCEICGGASYWGRRAFEKHFQEWRHAYGMKCLKIPNTVHFKDVTEIEHALRLHKKILQDNFETTFKPDFQEEFEDDEGNLYNRRQYIDLKRQGLI